MGRIVWTRPSRSREEQPEPTLGSVTLEPRWAGALRIWPLIEGIRNQFFEPLRSCSDVLEQEAKARLFFVPTVA